MYRLWSWFIEWIDRRYSLRDVTTLPPKPQRDFESRMLPRDEGVKEDGEIGD